MKKLLITALTLLIVTTLPAHAEEREWVSYKKLVEATYLDKFYRVEQSQRDHLRLLIQVMPENKFITPSTIVLTVAHSGGKERLPISAEGYMDIVPNAEWIKEDAKIYTSLPKTEKSGIAAIFASKTPEALQLNYAELMASVPQWNALIKEQAGVLRFMLPKFNAILLHFPKAAQQTIQVIAKDGTKTYMTDSKGELKLKLDEALQKENPKVMLSEKPSWVEVDEI